MPQRPPGKRAATAVQAERFKMLAGGTQLIAIGVLGASVIAPTFNSAQRFDVWLAGTGGAVAGLLELAAWALMGYGVVPSAAETEGDHA